MSKWLTEITARPEAEAKLDELRTAMHRGRVVTREAGVAQAVQTVNSAAIHLATSPFTHSVGVVFAQDPLDRETWYVCGSKAVGGYFADHNVIPWTHWLGQVATQLRNALDRGEIPTQLRYGPQGKERELPVGPLVDYVIRNGELLSLEFNQITIAQVAPAVADEEAESSVDDGSITPPVQPAFGLKTIIQTLDLDQDEQIRGPMDGVFILTGGPGVGKTTVALHRIPYLILEQNRSSSWSMADEEADAFFTAESTLVVVWKQHLVEYLRGCIHELVNEFPERNVRHFDKWVADILREYIPTGKDGWRFHDESPQWVEQIKESLTEEQIERFLRSNFDIRQASESAFRERLPNRFGSALTNRLTELRWMPQLPFAFSSPEFSIDAFEQLRDRLLQQLPEPREAAKQLSDTQLDELRGIREKIQDAHREALIRMARYPDLLFAFYGSKVVSETVKRCGTDIDQFRETLDEQRQNRLLTRFDTYLLIWLIHLITDGASSNARRTKPLPRYSHVVIDEAQYYAPIALRLFGDLVGLPDGVLTIVGDLEQRISTQGGLVSWEDTDFDLGTDRINRLVTNYRWTEEVFAFLDLFHNAAAITETLNRPLKWRVLGGMHPEIHTLANRDEELKLVAQRISDLRNDPNSKDWTITVVVPTSCIDTTARPLVERLESYFVEARWATGEDVKESVDRVIVTDYDSIVGLEFDCIVAPHLDEQLRELDRPAILSTWVGLTRARRFICVTRSAPDPIFDRNEFSQYHISSEPQDSE